MTKALAAVFVPIGITGAVIAIACALVAAFALARGSAGLTGGAVGVWIVGALLSISASFAALWTPFLVAVISLGIALMVGLLVRGALAPLRAHRASAAQAEPAQAETETVKATASAARPLGRSTDVIAVI